MRRADANLGYQGNRKIPALFLQPGITPLTYAVALNGDEETICELLAHGANPNQRFGLAGSTALHGAGVSGLPEGILALHRVCARLSIPLDVECRLYRAN